MSSFLQGLNTGAQGAVRGVALADEIMQRREAGARDDRRMAIAEAGEERASRLGAIQEQGQQLALDQAQQKAAWQKEDQTEFAAFHNEKDDKGNTIPWTPERELQWGERVFSRAHSRGQVTPEQYKHMVDLRDQFDTKKMKGAWAAVLAGDDKGAAPLREKFDAKELRVSRNKENGMWEITGTKNDDTPISMPLGMASPIVGEKAGKEINDWLKDSADADAKKEAAKAEKAKYQYYVGRDREAREGTAEAKRRDTISREMARIFGDDVKSIGREGLELQKEEAKIDADPLSSEKEKAARRTAIGVKRSGLQQRAQNLQREQGDISSILDSAHESGLKNLTSDRARDILRKAGRGENVVVDPRNNDAYYEMPNGKRIPLPPGLLPREIFDKLKGGAAPAPAAARPAAAIPVGPTATPTDADFNAMQGYGQG